MAAPGPELPGANSFVSVVGDKPIERATASRPAGVLPASSRSRTRNGSQREVGGDGEARGGIGGGATVRVLRSSTSAAIAWRKARSRCSGGAAR